MRSLRNAPLPGMAPHGEKQMGSLRKSLKRKAFRKAKEVLPDSTVLEIQRRRLEGRKVFGPEPKPGSYAPSTTYAVVSAVYNVEAYLDDYLESLMSQTIDPAALRVIAVDDGSTDASAEVIRSWQERFPGRIDYVRKENGGQASARNLGMSMVEAEWVTFIDPDDFVSRDYFEQVDRAIAAHPQLRFVSCNTVYYNERKRRYIDSHPLKRRFDGDTFFEVGDEAKFIQLSSSSAFFSCSHLEESKVRFNEELVSNFEDALFLNRYLVRLTDGSVGFLSRPKYYYRKRSNSSSSLDRSWGKRERFTVTPRVGYLALLHDCKDVLGHVPLCIQRTILYDLSWYFKRFIGHPERWAFLSCDERMSFVRALKDIFSFVSSECVISAPDEWVNSDLKNIILSYFRHEPMRYRAVFVKHIDLAKRRMLVRYVGNPIACVVDELPAPPLCSKKTDVLFFDEVLAERRNEWFALGSESSSVSFNASADESMVFLRVGCNILRGKVSSREIIDCFTANWGRYARQSGAWIIMDRDTQADDNGEHFYRYMMREHPEQKCYFALRKSASDWNRLEDEGFDLLDFGSRRHERILRHCSKIISSHANGFVHSYFGDNFFHSKDFVFLQHGVTKDDISAWLNPKPISLLTVATEAEYQSIVKDGSPYELTQSQVVLTGFPRHDALAKEGLISRETILVMPTWRNSLVGNMNEKGNIREIHSEFLESEYKRVWEDFLGCSKLRDISDSSGCRIVFFPHANIAPYLKQGFFSLPDYVELGINMPERSIQDFFREASVMVTDYSSAAFEMAYLNKPCLYYQFDRESFFSGAQIYSQGYFDYENDGFGPVVFDQDALLASLELFFENGLSFGDLYEKRLERLFPYRDGKCCERVYAAICEHLGAR